MAQGATGNHGHDHAGRCGEGCRNQARLVSDTAGGVFVYLGARNVRKIDGDAAGDHRIRQGAYFAVRHPRVKHRHQERRHLIIGNATARVAFDQVADFLHRQLFAIPLTLNKVHCTHVKV